MVTFFEKMTEEEARNVNSLVLAYVGDAVHSLIVRERLVHNHDCKAGQLHVLASQQVNAHSQAMLADKVLPLLTEEEADIFRRGRNVKSHHTAKNQTRCDYRQATAIEAVIGYLYLTGKTDRLMFLLGEGNEDRG